MKSSKIIKNKPNGNEPCKREKKKKLIRKRGNLPTIERKQKKKIRYQSTILEGPVLNNSSRENEGKEVILII